jgi:RimJ/RimL family protein N-acetyltransferase
MTRPYLVPYKAEHAMSFLDRDKWSLVTWGEATDRERYPSYTGMVDETILGCAGIILPWPGVGIAWLTMSPVAAVKFKIWMTRTCRRVLDDVSRSFHLHRLEAVVLDDSLVNKQWIEVLGFSVEKDGVAQRYLPDGRGVVRYERIIP